MPVAYDPTLPLQMSSHLLEHSYIFITTGEAHGCRELSAGMSIPPS
jgi:hypothetical protein